MLFAKALKGQDVGALLSNIGSAGPAAGPAAAAGGDAPAEAKQEEQKDWTRQKQQKRPERNCKTEEIQLLGEFVYSRLSFRLR